MHEKWSAFATLSRFLCCWFVQNECALHALVRLWIFHVLFEL